MMILPIPFSNTTFNFMLHLTIVLNLHKHISYSDILKPHFRNIWIDTVIILKRNHFSGNLKCWVTNHFPHNDETVRGLENDSPEISRCLGNSHCSELLQGAVITRHGTIRRNCRPRISRSIPADGISLPRRRVDIPISEKITIHARGTHKQLPL